MESGINIGKSFIAGVAILDEKNFPKLCCVKYINDVLMMLIVLLLSHPKMSVANMRTLQQSFRNKTFTNKQLADSYRRRCVPPS